MSGRPVRVRIQLAPPPGPVPVSSFEIEPRSGRTPPACPAPAVVVVDVLRATTTLAFAFANGAREALFFAEPDAAAAAMTRVARPFLLCGEREGLRIPRFDLGNSPLEYVPERVRGAALLFASTNGSLAFLATASAEVQWAVGFVNLEAAVAAVSSYLVSAEPAAPPGDADLLLQCAGKLGEPASEDTACAGRFALRLMATLAGAGRDVEVLADGGALALAPESEEETLRAVAESEHGRYLATLGPEFVADVEACARWDTVSVVPRGRGARLRS